MDSSIIILVYILSTSYGTTAGLANNFDNEYIIQEKELVIMQ